MISLEQIQLLESRVMKAVRRIETLQNENDTLRERLGRYEKRIQELEVLINEFKDGQSEIEQGIMNALSQLDAVEDEALDGETASGPEPRNENPQAGTSSSSDREQSSPTAPGQGSSHEAGGEQAASATHDAPATQAASATQAAPATHDASATQAASPTQDQPATQNGPITTDKPAESAVETDRSTGTNTSGAQPNDETSDSEHDADNHRSAELDIF